MLAPQSLLHHQLHHIKRVEITNNLFTANLPTQLNTRQLGCIHLQYWRSHTTKKTKFKTSTILTDQSTITLISCICQNTSINIEDENVLIPRLQTHHMWWFWIRGDNELVPKDWWSRWSWENIAAMVECNLFLVHQIFHIIKGEIIRIFHIIK